MIKYLDELDNMCERLDLPISQIVIVASGVMAVYDVRENCDLDVVVSEYVWEKLSKVFTIEVSSLGSETIRVGNIEYFNKLMPNNISTSLIPTITLGGYCYQTISSLIDWKIAIGRDKDKADLKLIFSNRTILRMLGIRINNCTLDDLLVAEIIQYYWRKGMKVGDIVCNGDGELIIYYFNHTSTKISITSLRSLMDNTI